jgi:hypothetical protein
LYGGCQNEPTTGPVPDDTQPLRFPTKLVQAVGQAAIDAAPTIVVAEGGTGYFDNCINESMFQAGSNVIKGRDQYGRVFFSFLMHNDNYAAVENMFAAEKKRCVIFTVFQRYLSGSDVDEELFCHRQCWNAPTSDENFFRGCVMDNKKYEAVAQVFHKTHPDLALGK